MKARFAETPQGLGSCDNFGSVGLAGDCFFVMARFAETPQGLGLRNNYGSVGLAGGTARPSQNYHAALAPVEFQQSDPLQKRRSPVSPTEPKLLRNPSPCGVSAKWAGQSG